MEKKVSNSEKNIMCVDSREKRRSQCTFALLCVKMSFRSLILQIYSLLLYSLLLLHILCLILRRWFSLLISLAASLSYYFFSWPAAPTRRLALRRCWSGPRAFF